MDKQSSWRRHGKSKVLVDIMHKWEVNLAAVWGQMSTGGGHSSLQQSIAFLGVPVMAKKSYTATEEQLVSGGGDIFSSQ